jgi:hypothetical protein
LALSAQSYVSPKTTHIRQVSDHRKEAWHLLSVIRVRIQCCVQRERRRCLESALKLKQLSVHLIDDSLKIIAPWKIVRVKLTNDWSERCTKNDFVVRWGRTRR